MGSAGEFDAFERNGWMGRAEAYDRGYARLTAHTVEPLLNTVKAGPRTRLLEVGCGPGQVTAAALARGAQVTASDADLDMLELVARRHPHATVRLAALPELPFPDEEFDAVVGNFVINHVGDPEAALAELHRILRPGGHIALTCWGYPGMRANAVFGEAIRAAGARPPDGLPDAGPFANGGDPKTFAGLLRDAGFVGASADTLRWTHRVDPDEWWEDVLAGTVVNPAVINRQSPEVVARIKAQYDRIVGEYASADGLMAFPACALLAHATR